MLKTLDILIGGVTVLLLFSMAVTVITQAVTNLFNQRGKHLMAGLASLIQQLGISDSKLAENVSKAVLSHPIIAGASGKLGTVIHRQEFTKLLMDLASGQGHSTLEGDALTALQQMLKNNGIADPAQTLKNVRAMSLVIASSNPTLANHMRDELALLQEAASDYVAKVHSWFDQTIDRVSQAFSGHAQRVTVAAAFLVVLVVQLDIIAVLDRLSIDDQFRNAVVTAAATNFNNNPQTQANIQNGDIDPHPYYNLLNQAGLITMPTSSKWLDGLKEPRKYPGMVISILLISLGAPFWYNVLKNLLGLRSALTQKDDLQRAQRQLPSSADGASSIAAAVVTSVPNAIVGERGPMPTPAG